MPDWTAYVRRHLKLTRLEAHREVEIVEDVARQLDDVYRAALARGESQAEAEAAVRQQVPDWPAFAAELQRSSSRHETSRLDALREAGIARESAAGARFSGLGSDAVQALRQLASRPGFTAVAALTIALGVGANTTVFSLVNGVLRLPLPVADIEGVVRISEQNLEEGVTRGGVSLPTFLDVRSANRSFVDLYAGRRVAYNFDAGGDPQRIGAYTASDRFFALMRIQPALGRVFGLDDHAVGADRVAVLADWYWQSEFGADPDVVGDTIRLDGQPVTVVGVAPAEFWFPEKNTALWTPLTHVADEESRGDRNFGVLARVSADADLEQARAELLVIGGQIAQARPDTQQGWNLNAVPIREDLVSQISVVLTILYSAITFVLLIACANVANLLLARATDRGREIAVRSALGAGRGRLVRQLLAESLALALLGGALGILMALAGMGAVRSQVADTNLALLVDGIRMDRYVLGHALGITALAGLIFGIVPALHASRASLHTLLKDGGRAAGGRRRHRARNALVVAQVALALALLAPTGLLVRLLAEDRQQDLRIDVERFMTLRTHLSDARYPEWTGVLDFYDRSIARLGAAPGVVAAGVASRIPALAPVEPNLAVIVEGSPPGAEAGPEVVDAAVSPGYLEMLGVELLSGRQLSSLDRAETVQVAVVSQAMADRYWPGDAAVGKRFRRADESAGWVEVVGVVSDVGARVMNEPYVPHAYVPVAQRPSRELNLVVRTAADPTGTLPAIRRALAEVDAHQPFYEARTMSWLTDRARATDSFLIGLLAVLAGLALVLALVGIYGVISYSVQQKTREIGIQMALGARATAVVFGVMRQGLYLATAGLALGLLSAAAIVRTLEAEVADLGGISAAGPSTLAAVGLFMVFTAMLACYLPARRATCVDPSVVLRQD